MSDPEEIITLGIAFVVLFFIGGIVGVASLPDFQGRFYLSGLVVASFGTGGGSLIIKAVINR